ncbi:Na/Pi cotransporter family protein [Gemmatimonadota bacterium]
MFPATELELGPLLTGLGGGLALFLYGMRIMTDSLKVVAGDRMKDILARFTKNRVTGAISGAVITAVIQSSSVTTVMVVGFVTAGLLNFTQSIGVIMGANIGTTVTAQIVAFKVTKYALAMIAAGFLTELLGKNPRVRHWGVAVMGLGLLFYGMDLMSTAALPLRAYPPFIEMMQELRSPWAGILVGFGFTAIVQSSSATTGIVIVLATQGLISLEAGIALVFGANVGTCVTATLSAIGKPRDAWKAAAVHVAFNLVGVLLWVAFIPQLADLIRMLSPMSAELEGAQRLAAEVPRQIANAHTVFNIVNTVIFLGFAGQVAALVERIVPKPTAAERKRRGPPTMLEPLFLDQPGLALDLVKRELVRMGEGAVGMVEGGLTVALKGGPDMLSRLETQDDEVDEAHTTILAYLGKLSLGDLVGSQGDRMQEYIAVANYLENVGDSVATGMVAAGHKRIENGLAFPTEIVDLFGPLGELSTESIRSALLALQETGTEGARGVIGSKAIFDGEAEAVRTELWARLAAEEEESLQVYRLAMENVDNLKRIHTLGRRIAKAVLKAREPEALKEP